MRKYMVWGTKDEKLWEPIGTVEAASHDQAQDTAAEQVPGFVAYGSLPFGNWRAGKPTTYTKREWSEFDITSTGQLTVEDELEAPQDDLVARAEDALAKKAQEK